MDYDLSAPQGQAAAEYQQENCKAEKSAVARASCPCVTANIPATTTSLPKNTQGIGALGNNSINGRTGYAPPHSKGPGPKTYVYTVYALSSPVTINVKPSEVSRDILLAAMKDKILASAELRVVYSRDVQKGSP